MHDLCAPPNRGLSPVQEKRSLANLERKKEIDTNVTQSSIVEYHNSKGDIYPGLAKWYRELHTITAPFLPPNIPRSFKTTHSRHPEVCGFPRQLLKCFLSALLSFAFVSAHALTQLFWRALRQQAPAPPPFLRSNDPSLGSLSPSYTHSLSSPTTVMGGRQTNYSLAPPRHCLPHCT